MSDQETAKTLLGLNGQKPSQMFAEKMDEMFSTYGPLISLLGMSKEQFTDWAFAHSKANFGEFHAEMVGPLKASFAEATGQLAERTAEAHRRSLDNSLSPEPRVEKMKEYEWRVVHTGSPLALPDCVAIAFDAKGDAFPLMLAETDEAEAIFVPLASDRLLAGSKLLAKAPADLNDVFAACAWDFFVASVRTPEFEARRDKIRTEAANTSMTRSTT